MKKILFIDGNLSCGGAEVLLVQYANLLSKYYDVTILTREDYNDQLSYKLSNLVKYHSIINCKSCFITRIIRFILFKILSKQLLFYYIYIFRKIKFTNYDYVVSFLEGFSTKLIKDVDIIKYAWIHTDLIDNNWCYLNDNINDVYKSFDKIIFVSNNSLNKYRARYYTDTKFISMHNVINIKQIIDLGNESMNLDNNDNLFTVVSVGRLEKIKGYDRLIDAAILLNKEKFNFKIIIIGDGSDYKNLENRIKENGLEKVIYLYGFQKNPYKYIKKSDILILPSISESLPNVLYEALILGKPVIATQTAGSLEVLENGEYGLIVENSMHGIYIGLHMVLANKFEYNILLTKAQEARKKIIKENDKNYHNLMKLFK